MESLFHPYKPCKEIGVRKHTGCTRVAEFEHARHGSNKVGSEALPRRNVSQKAQNGGAIESRCTMVDGSKIGRHE